MTKEERFWSKVDVRGADDCWLWTRCVSTPGYGQFCGRSAHRVAYELAKGPIPQGLCVLHSCDVRRCCNPAHLRVGTNADNMRDKLERGREGHGAYRKLTARQVRAIRAKAHRMSTHTLAREYAISQSSIWLIINGRSYKHV